MPSKIPMRGISKLLTNLDPGVRARLEDAFVEAEDLSNFHNDAAINTQQKRVLSSLVDAPVLSIDTNAGGYDVNWPKLRDRLVSFYEVQVSTSSNFGTVQTYKTVDNFFAAEGVTTDTFIRVRAVRWDGQMGNWSNSVSVTASVVSTPVVYARDLGDIPSFYREFPALVNPIQHLNIIPQKANGGIVVFGSFGIEFYIDPTTHQRIDYAITDPDTAFNDSLSVTMNGFPTNTSAEIIPAYSQSGFLFDAIGYSVGFGPAFLPHSGFYHSTYVHNPSAFTEGAAHDSNSTQTGWTSKINATGLTGVNDVAATTYDCVNLGSGKTTITKALTGKKHNFSIGHSRTVTGIKVTLWCAQAILPLDPNTGTATLIVNHLSLVDNGSTRATDYSAATPVPSTLTGLEFGGVGDLWGEVAGFWTPAKINSKNFGTFLNFAISAAGGTASYEFQLYGIEITVYTTNIREEAEVNVIYIPATDDIVTYPGRRGILKNCTLNVIEFGDDIT